MSGENRSPGFTQLWSVQGPAPVYPRSAKPHMRRRRLSKRMEEPPRNEFGVAGRLGRGVEGGGDRLHPHM
jgi:hypothetical protein